MTKDTKFQVSYQGSLDYFCGIYAVINAVGIACSEFKILTYEEKCDFFRYFLLYLLNNNMIEHVIKRGSPCILEEEYLRLAQKYMKDKYHILVQWRKISSFKKLFNLDYEKILSVLQYWVKRRRHSCVVRVKTAKIGDHWTVFKKVKFPMCYLSDSDHFLKLKFNGPAEKVGTKTKNKKDEIKMMKKGIFLIRAKKIR